MTLAIILNVIFAGLVVAGVVGLLGAAIYGSARAGGRPARATEPSRSRAYRARPAGSLGRTVAGRMRS